MRRLSWPYLLTDAELSDPLIIQKYKRLYDNSVLIVGPMSSGTRLLCDIVNHSNSLWAAHDGKHGTVDWPWKKKGVILLYRNQWITELSYKDHWFINGISYDQSYKGMKERYPHFDLAISYEKLVQDPSEEIKKIAKKFRVPEWEYPFPVVDRNLEKIKELFKESRIL